ncbi:NrsF family protein [Paraburkholderia strydomiana]|uniref:NrsF family protein n=1 Tax=Paraburkholderia strydomiana TaxID=1245417 RepID=UPI001BE8837C|nr:NrsF family protein [Paraburkholderia strydomiana]MBT2790049.1 DUF1109 family protein [Paraburkholderia strydomiana]
MKTDDLINLLANDTPVRWPLGRALMLAFFSSIFFTAVMFFGWIHPRPDLAQAAETVRFLFKFVVTIALAMTTMGLVVRVARPGVPLGLWCWSPIAVPILLVAAVIAELLVMPESSWAARWIGVNISQCLTLIPLMAIVPLACFLVALRRGAPTHPGAAGAIARLVSSGIAATFYASHCTDDSPLFVITWYPLATSWVVFAGYIAGSRFLRW